jgi:hypothetical protein
MSSTSSTTTSIKPLRPNEEGYQEWAEKALEIIRGKYGIYANYLKKKEIPAKDVEISEPPDEKTQPAQYAVWKVRRNVGDCC